MTTQVTFYELCDDTMRRLRALKNMVAENHNSIKDFTTTYATLDRVLADVYAIKEANKRFIYGTTELHDR